MAVNAQIQASIDALVAEVTAERTVVQAAVTLMNGLTAQIAALKDELAAGGDPAVVVTKLTDVLNGFAANKQDLANGVVANTPAA